MARPRSELGDIRTSPRSVRILRWLRRKPQPARIMGETDDGEEVIAVVAATGPAQWTDVLGVVRPCVKLKAVDAKDNVLRVLELDPDDPELRAESETEQALANVSKGRAGSVPIISVDIPKLVDNLARNMREVAGESARMHAAATKDAFAGMASVVNLCLGLLVRMENRLAAAEDAMADATAAAQGEPGDERTKLAMMALQQLQAKNGTGGGGGFDLTALLKMMQQQQQNGGSDAG